MGSHGARYCSYGRSYWGDENVLGRRTALVVGYYAFSMFVTFLCGLLEVCARPLPAFAFRPSHEPKGHWVIKCCIMTLYCALSLQALGLTESDLLPFLSAGFDGLQYSMLFLVFGLDSHQPILERLRPLWDVVVRTIFACEIHDVPTDVSEVRAFGVRDVWSGTMTWNLCMRSTRLWPFLHLLT
jgi:hypothetical protein